MGLITDAMADQYSQFERERLAHMRQMMGMQNALSPYSHNALGGGLAGALAGGLTGALGQQASTPIPIPKPEPNPVLLLLGEDE